jgi:hypothetical protein
MLDESREKAFSVSRRAMLMGKNRYLTAQEAANELASARIRSMLM